MPSAASYTNKLRYQAEARNVKIQYRGGVSSTFRPGLSVLTDTFTRTHTTTTSTGGIISTFAGNGLTGFPGDGGAGVDAQLRAPSGVAMDTYGNIYIADFYNNRVCKVDTYGMIATIAGTGTSGFGGDGGPATDAQLNTPSGVAVDSVGNVYIADTGNNRVRKVDTSGSISTIAGTGDRWFYLENYPAIDSPMTVFDIAVDTYGNIYIADCINCRIRKVDASTGNISTIAGTGVPGFSGDGGPATDAQVNYPTGVAVESAGTVYIADTGNSRVRKVDTIGNISTIAGTGTSGDFGDGGLATDAQLGAPTGVAMDPYGNIYIADKGNNRVRKVALVNGFIFAVAGNGLVVSNTVATQIPMFNPTFIYLDGNGRAYITEPSRGKVRMVDTSGNISTIAGTGTSGFSGDGGPATDAQLNTPSSVAVDSAGNVYIADRGNNCVRKVDTIGNISTIAGVDAQLNTPSGVAVDSAGNVYIADTGNNRILKVDTSGSISTIAGTGVPGFSGDGGLATDARVNYPTGVAVDSAGNIYITDYGNNRVRKVDTSGSISTLAGTGDSEGFSGDGGAGVDAQLNAPSGVAVDTYGNIYIADTGNNRIRKVDALTGIISTIAGSNIQWFGGDGGLATAAQLNQPRDVAVDSAGNIYIADYANNRIRKMTPLVVTTKTTETYNPPWFTKLEYSVPCNCSSKNFTVCTACSVKTTYYVSEAGSADCGILLDGADSGVVLDGGVE